MNVDFFVLIWFNLNFWILGYLFGIIPSGHLISRAKGINISSHGSGNVGATNVALVVGKSAGVLTLICDVSKGLAAVAVASYLADSLDSSRTVFYNSASLSAAVGVVCGHCFSIPPLLKGGKGVATSLGAILAISPLLGISALLCFLAIVTFKGIVSLASIGAALSVPLLSCLLGGTTEQIQSLTIMAIIVIARHRTNITRILQGTEEPLTKKR